jgi:Ca2+-binding EF-hand superfamily protein
LYENLLNSFESEMFFYYEKSEVERTEKTISWFSMLTNENLLKHHPIKKNKKMSLTEEQLATYKQQFGLFDIDGDGKITIVELKQVFINLGKKKKFKFFFSGQEVSETELNSMLSEVDTDGNGTIEFEEFITLVDRLGLDDESNTRQAFEYFDKDNNGYIDEEELKEVMSSIGQKLTDKQVN